MTETGSHQMHSRKSNNRLDNRQIMKTIPKIVTMTPSARWRSSVEFQLTQVLPGVKIFAALDFEDSLIEVGQHQPVVAVIELTSTRLPSVCATLGQRLSTFPETIFVAVGDSDLLPWVSLLMVSGFADVCCNVAEIATMCERIKRHASTVQGNRADSKLETVIQDQLPWKAVRAADKSHRVNKNQEQVS